MRLPVEGPEERVHGTPKLVLDDRPGVFGGKRLHLVEQLKELQAVVGGENVEPQRQRLPQLDPQAAHLFQDRLHPLGAGRSGAAQHPGNEQVVENGSRELPGAPEHREHQKASRSVCTLRTSTTPHSIERSHSARLVLRPWGGSAKLRKTTTASSVAACRTARASRER